MALKMDVPLFAPLGWEDVQANIVAEFDLTQDCLVLGAITLPVGLGGLVHQDASEPDVQA